MDLSKLPKIVDRSAKRVGRGIGSGKGGHTAGRGTKGQKARGKVRQLFEGTKSKKSLIKRLPFLRGRNKLKPWDVNPIVINLEALQDWPEKTAVTTENLVKRGVIGKDEAKRGVKILGNGKIERALTVKIAVSKSTAKKIEKAGGKIDSGV